MMEATVQPCSLKVMTKFKKDKNVDNSSATSGNLNILEEKRDASSSPNSPRNPTTPPTTPSEDTLDLPSAQVEDHKTEDNGNQISENSEYQLVLYDPSINGGSSDENTKHPVNVSPLQRIHPFLDRTPWVLPSVGAFTVQCASCFKWRLIPTKEKYEEIREHIVERPFLCEMAREWRPDVSCDDPPDITQDGSRLWVIDKPNIAQPPPGWQRLLRIRGEGSTKFANVYYVAPSGERLRSIVEIQKYLDQHPEYMEGGVSLSKFSFQIRKPLQENYVRKRPHSPLPNDAIDLSILGYLPPPEEKQNYVMNAIGVPGAPWFGHQLEFPSQFPFISPALYGFSFQRSSDVGSNLSRRNITDGVSTHKDHGTPSSERTSHFPTHCSPQGLENINLANLDTEDKRGPTQLKKQPYSYEENEHLARCWIDISTDLVVGNARKLDQMWLRIAKVYNKNRPVNTPVRPWAVLKTHFYTLQRQVKWFEECYSRIAKFWRSGCSNADIMMIAHKEYTKIHNKCRFKHVGMWNILKEYPKFANANVDARGLKKTKISKSGAYIFSSNPDSSANKDADAYRISPIGQKTANRKTKEKGKFEVYKHLKQHIESNHREKMEAIEQVVRRREYKILMKDTANMTVEQRIIHQKMCEEIKKTWGM